MSYVAFYLIAIPFALALFVVSLISQAIVGRTIKRMGESQPDMTGQEITRRFEADQSEGGSSDVHHVPVSEPVGISIPKLIDHDRIEAMVKTGVPVDVISRRLHVSKRSVNRLIKARGLNYDPIDAIGTEDEYFFWEVYRTFRETPSTIAYRFGFSRQYMHEYFSMPRQSGCHFPGDHTPSPYDFDLPADKYSKSHP